MSYSKQEGGMGFHNLASFNRAMLTKQAWRLLITLDTLTARVIKVRYFPHCDLIEATLGYRPSYIWQSLLEGLTLLKSDLEWRISSGTKVNIWFDRWLPNSSTGYPTYSVPGSDYYPSVAQLIDLNSRSWHEGLLATIFHPDDVQRILSITLSHRNTEDTIRWRGTPNGLYTVRSGYYQDLMAGQGSNRTEQGAIVNRELWQKVWNAEYPPWVKHFVWRVISNCLPVRSNLTLQGIEVEDNCPLCQQASESLTHLFFLCPVAVAFWMQEGIEVSSFLTNSIYSACSSLIDGISAKDRSRRFCLMWRIWKVRNKLVFDTDNPVDAPRIIAAALKLGEDYDHANATNTTENVRPDMRWHPPEAGWYKVNTDAGLSREGGGQVGVVVLDSEGLYIAGAIRRFPFVSHPTLLEAHGYKMGLELAVSLGLSQVIMESDCRPIVLAINQELNDRSDLATIIEDCLSVAESIAHVRHLYIPRSANGAAHAMAKLPCLFSAYPLFMFTAPLALSSILSH